MPTEVTLQMREVSQISYENTSQWYVYEADGLQPLHGVRITIGDTIIRLHAPTVAQMDQLIMELEKATCGLKQWEERHVRDNREQRFVDRVIAAVVNHNATPE